MNYTKFKLKEKLSMFNIMCSTSPKIPPVKTFITAKLDSGASKHYFRPCDTAALKNIRSISNGPSISLPDGRLLQIKYKGLLPLHDIVNKNAGEVKIVPQLNCVTVSKCVKKHILLNIDFSNRDGGTLPYMRY